MKTTPTGALSPWSIIRSPPPEAGRLGPCGFPSLFLLVLHSSRCRLVFLFAVGGRSFGGCFDIVVHLWLRFAGGFGTIVVVLLGGCLGTLWAWRVLVVVVVVLADALPPLFCSVVCLVADSLSSWLSSSLADAFAAVVVMLRGCLHSHMWPFSPSFYGGNVSSFCRINSPGGVLGGEVEESFPSCFFCWFCVLCLRLRPPLFVVVGHLCWLLFFSTLWRFS
jgi:hypothetical protein